MTVYIKWSGAWRAAADGRVWIKWNGVWNVASYVHIRSGGVWRDSGYRGYPNPPQNSVHVYDWPNYTQIRASWGGPAAGGGPVASYDIAMTDSSGNLNPPMEVFYGVQPPSPWFHVNQDYQVAFFARSRGSTGLLSGWVQGWYLNPNAGDYRLSSRAIMGHTEIARDVVESRTRGWESNHLSGYRNRDDPFWCTAPTSVLITGMHWRNIGTPQSSVVTPYNNRTVNWVVPWTGDPISAYLGTVYTGHSRDHPLNNWGDGGAWGLVARGAGWSTTGNTTYMWYTDNFWLSGTETYYVNVRYVDRAAAGNNYW